MTFVLFTLMNSKGPKINIDSRSINGKTSPDNMRSVSSDNHIKTSKLIDNITNILKTAGLKIGEQTTIKLIDGAITNLIDSTNEQVGLSGMTSVSNLGVNTSTITKSSFHIGEPTTSRLKKQGNNPLVEFYSKVLASSFKDYIQHNKRKHLTLTTGFEQKGYSFLMEDTFLTVKNLLKLFGKDTKIKENLLKNENSLRNVYGCIYNSRLRLKISSGIDYYSLKVQIHLIKLTDIHDDVRELISEFTNNKINIPIIDSTSSDDISKVNATFVERLLRRGKKVVKSGGEKKALDKLKELIDQSNISIDWKDTIKSIFTSQISSEGSLRGRKVDLGRINDDEQYSEPNVTDIRNKFCISFDTSIRTKLNDSILFRDRAKIIHTWSRVLTPGSMWDFNLTQHFGKGIHLNYLYDIENLNDDHPATYILAIEHFGDARAKLVRKKDNDTFFGYGPSRLRVEFEHRINYLGTQKDGMLDSEDPLPCVYKSKRREEDFEKNSELAKIFTPDREPRFNIPFDDIQMIEDNKKTALDKDFILQYDTTIMPAESLLEGLKQTYQNRGFSGSDVTEDDLNKNVPEKEYEGTEDQNIDSTENLLNDL